MHLSKPPRASAFPPIGRAGSTILVIEDDDDLRALLALALRHDGHDVTTAVDAFDALAALRRRRFDLVVTELDLPGVAGVEMLAALKVIDPDVDVIVGTSGASVASAVACMKHGAYDYLEKPYDLSSLRALARCALGQGRALADVRRVAAEPLGVA
jgi:DNA-binding NtrC family response regulator